MERVNNNMLALARESRGMTQVEIAEQLGTTQGNIGKLERGDYNVSREWLNGIARLTHYPYSFFYQKGEIIPENINYRRREKVAQAVLSPLNAKINIERFRMQIIAEALEIPPVPVPVFEVSEENTPAHIAAKLRKQWKIAPGPIDNMTSVLEHQGIVIDSFDFNTSRVDCRCLLTDNGIPVIFTNSSLLGDRLRFSLAFQLGHLVMHSGDVAWNRDTGHEANLFAAELLMPEPDIRPDFEQGLSVPILADLKKKWKVSMISLLYRADDLGYLTPYQKKQVLLQFNEMHIRRREPVELDVPLEQPVMLKEWLERLRTEKELDVAQIAAMLHCSENEFTELYNI
jgi:Zn-dependent peptidase ImmA (M78 family)/DNA-binding XRE family transcriptional regulator